jgi:hypothetical protein
MIFLLHCDCMLDPVDDIFQRLSTEALAPPRPFIQEILAELDETERRFPDAAQNALIVRLIRDWEQRKTDERMVAITSLECGDGTDTACTHYFGVLTSDWPGLSNSCLGVIHQMGWNVDYIKAFSISRAGGELGIVLIGIKTDTEEKRQSLIDHSSIIFSRLRQAAVGTGAKAYLLSEEIRKLEIYSQAIAYIEKHYPEPDIEQIIGMNGEAVKFFAARSRDYIENRKVEDIAEQIVRNYTFIKIVHDIPDSIQLDVSNQETRTEGVFTTVTVAGPTRMLNLEDCLKTIALTIPNFSLKHNREFTTNEGVSLYRIEFVDSLGFPLAEPAHARLRNAFSTLVLNKRQNRAQWIESIGGFEHYARAIIPLLVKEARNTKKTQVYQSVGQTTELFIEFKIIVVVPDPTELRKKLVTKTVRAIEDVPGLEIFGVKPPKTYDNAEVFIIDLRASLAILENVETIYKTIKDNIHKAVGEFRDFDEGMRTIDTEKFKSVRRMIDGIDKSLIRELYYCIEDFFRVGASIDEIVFHIRLTLEMLGILEKQEKKIHVLFRQTGPMSAEGTVIPRASLLCVAYPNPQYLLQKILEILENVEVTLSRLERPRWNILICRITFQDKALSEDELGVLTGKILKLDEKK